MVCMIKLTSFDFSYSHYGDIIKEIRKNYEILLLKDLEKGWGNDDTSCVVLRHDVDFDLVKAHKLAIVESNLDISSTFHIIPDSPFYSLEMKENKALLQEIVGMGHDVGLHWDIRRKDRPASEILNKNMLDEYIKMEAVYLEKCTGTNVTTVSFHCPMPELLRGEIMLGGLVNAYANEFMDEYISDSAGQWRHGDPLEDFKEMKWENIQVLTHPIWWNNVSRAPSDSLEDLYQERKKTNNHQDFDRLISENVTRIHRTGYIYNNDKLKFKE